MLAATGTHVPARELRLAFRDQGQTARYDRHQDLARHLLHSGHAIRDLAFNLAQRQEQNAVRFFHGAAAVVRCEAAGRGFRHQGGSREILRARHTKGLGTGDTRYLPFVSSYVDLGETLPTNAGLVVLATQRCSLAMARLRLRFTALLSITFVSRH